MINNQPKEKNSGDINYLVIEYLQSIPFNDINQKEKLIQNLIQNLSFGNVLDANLISHQSNYDLRGQIFRHLNTANLSEIINQYLCSKPLESEKYYVPVKEDQHSLSNKRIINSSIFNKKCDFLNMLERNNILNNIKTKRDELEYRTILNYSHMKTILGHVQMDENLAISPVPIFCMCFSEDSQFIYTGDDNGTIKIWSTQTGGIIETFRLFSPTEENSAINDMIAYNKCLIACSEDKTVVIWNTKTLQISTSFSFDEGLLNVNGYDYVYEGVTHHLLIIGAQSGKMYFIDMDINESTDGDYKNVFPIKFHIDKSIQDDYNLGRTKSLELAGMSSDDYNGLLVSGFHDGLVCIWDTTRILEAAIQKREFLHNFSQYVFYAQLCHRTTVQLIEFSPDKSHFLTGSLDGTVLVWKIFPDLISSVRKDYYYNKTIDKLKIPVGNIATIEESDDRIKCSVNVASWTNSSNYIIAMISSKPRKKQRNDNYDDYNRFNNNNNNYREEEIKNKKRTSSLIVYSLKLNKVIQKYNEHNGPKGLNFIDENYIFGCHPLYENIIFTLNGTRNIILFNIKTGEIIKKFKQNDFFFDSDKKTPLACEGVFSKRGDYFAISTYSGSLSIFSLYSKNSYSATYMNQFYSNEFDTNLEELNNTNRNNKQKSNMPSLNIIFPKHVNMYNLPYIIEQPYSSFKMEQIKSFKKILNNKYCITDNELKHRFLSNNLLTYEKNFDERVLECQKEEEAYYNAEKDNMNYRISRNNNNDEQGDQSVEDFGDESYDENESIHYNNNNNDRRNVNNGNYYNSYDDMEEDEYDNEELSRDDLRVTRMLRNPNNNISNNNAWSQRLRNTNNNIISQRNRIRNNNNDTNNLQSRNTSTRYNLRNNINNGSSHSNSNQRNNIGSSNNYYNLRNRQDNNDNINNNNTQITHFSIIDETNDIQTKPKNINIVYDDEEENKKTNQNNQSTKENEKKEEGKEEDYEYEEEDNVIIINKQKDEEKTKNKKEKEDDENYDINEEKNKSTKKLTKKKKKGIKKKLKGKKKLIDEDEEEYIDSKNDYSSENEENNKALKGLEAEELEDVQEEIEMKEDPDYSENNDDDDDDEDYSSSSSKNKKIKNKYHQHSNSKTSEHSNTQFKRDPNFLKIKNHKIIYEKIVKDKNSYTCFFCRQMFKGGEENDIKLIGPFYLNENTNKVLTTIPNSHLEFKEIYIDLNCLAENNDFVQLSKKDNIFNPTTTIEEVIKQNKTCFRCGNSLATRKCHLCQKVFHGNLCLEQMTELFNDQKYCLECFKKKFVHQLDDKLKIQKKLNYNNVSKKYFLNTKLFSSQYYPQIGEEVYFILHAYLSFLKSNEEYIIYELKESQRIFWWADSSYIEKNPNFSFYEPFLCKIKNMEFCFPDDKTISYIKSVRGLANLQEYLKILIKLKLQIIDLDNTVITIILFENNEPDFLVRKNVYEESLQYYSENIVNKKLQNFQVNLSEEVANVNLIDIKPEENNANFISSKFNSIKVTYQGEKEEQKFSFWDIVINNNNVNTNNNNKMIFIMKSLLDTVNSLCKKNEQLEIFREIVNEETVPLYYETVPVPMYIDLIKERLENKFYLTEESIRFDIDLLVSNSERYNGKNSQITEDAEVFKKRMFDEIDKLSTNYSNSLLITTSTNNNNIIINNENKESTKLINKKRKRVLSNLDIDEKMFYDDECEKNEDYLYGNRKKMELRNRNNNTNNSYNNISINISINNNNNNNKGALSCSKKKHKKSHKK